MDFKVLIFGPQLAGVLLLLVGLIQHVFPPKRINTLRGYRMQFDMKSKADWDEINRFARKLMVRLGLILLLAGVAATLLLQLIPNKLLREGLSVICMIGGSLSGALVLMSKIEGHLDKMETKNV